MTKTPTGRMAAMALASILLSALPALQASAQGAPPLAGLDPAPAWRLDTGSAGARRKVPAPARTRDPAPRARGATTSPDEADRAARLAAARRRFFEGQPADEKPPVIPEFGGYDSRRSGDGSLRPGATFKF